MMNCMLTRNRLINCIAKLQDSWYNISKMRFTPQPSKTLLAGGCWCHLFAHASVLCLPCVKVHQCRKRLSKHSK